MSKNEQECSLSGGEVSGGYGECVMMVLWEFSANSKASQPKVINYSCELAEVASPIC